MTVSLVRIDHGQPVRLRTVGFTHPQTTHGHLFKHVVRICGLPPEDLSSSEDPQRWTDLVDSPPLAADLTRRRHLALESLRACGSCLLGARAPAIDRVCDQCHDRRSIGSVDRAFADLLKAYVRVGREVFEWAVQNQSQEGPRLIAWRNDRGEITVKAIDGRRVLAVGRLQEAQGEIRLLSCYRLGPRTTIKSSWIALRRERVGYRWTGSLVSVTPA